MRGAGSPPPGKGDPAGTVVICTYDRPHLLAGALESLRSQEWDEDSPFEILVVDDGPGEETRRAASRAGARYVPTAGEGIAAARNLGIRESRGEWLAFFDDDQRASPGWLRELLRVSREREAPVVAGSRRLVPLEPGIPLPSHPRLRLYLGEEDWGESPRPLGPEEFPNTGNVLVRKDVFRRVGGFDPSFVEGGEDTDFFTRARRQGVPLWAAPSARADHLVGPAKVTPSWWKRRAQRGGAAEARIRRKGGGRVSLLAGLFRWGFLGSASLLPAGWNRLLGRREEALYRVFLFRHFLGYARQVPALLPGPAGGKGGGAPSFRKRGGGEGVSW